MKQFIIIVLLISGTCHAQDGDSSTYRQRARSEDQQGDYTAASADYAAYMRLYGDSATGCTSLAEVYVHMKNYKSAIALCNISLRLRPHYSMAYAIRGDARFGQKEYKAAIADYDTALMLDSVSMHSYYKHRSVAKFMLMDYAGASADSKRAASFAPLSGAAQASTDTRPIASQPHPAPASPQPSTSKPQAQTRQPTIKPQQKAPPPAQQVEFSDPWLDRYSRDTIFTLLKLSRALATDSDKAPLYASRGLIAHRQGKDEAACADFKTAQEMGYKRAEEMIKAYCK